MDRFEEGARVPEPARGAIVLGVGKPTESTMRRVLSALIAQGIVGSALLGAAAHAEIYSWVGADGQVNFSNLGPPPGVKVLGVVKDDPALRPPVDDAQREARMRALSDRVRQLEFDLKHAQNDVPAPPQIVVVAPPYPAPAGCDPAAYDCDGAVIASGYYPAYPVGVGYARTGHHHDRDRRFRPALNSRLVLPGMPSGAPPRR